ncbi:hypothetical protein C8R45DRAFT_1145973 [Mycena sanguinolenta]|nr:hypothetical protein C8R45DRAFT_1145973 [Mycena sanguinolenta]
MSHVPCANNSGDSSKCCLEPGTMTCSKCFLVKYCGAECQAQHWKTHKNACKHPYNNSSWQPTWMVEKRTPIFVGNDGPRQVVFGAFGNNVWGNVPAINCLQLKRNEGQRAASMDLKLCFAASGDIRNLIMTVNDLPDNYTGKCSILCNDHNGVIVNRNLVILFVLLSAGADVVDTAELAVHLMYSAALTPAMADYVQGCIETIYGTHGPQSGVWDTRGDGKIHSLQWLRDIQPALQMFRSKYKLPVAIANIHSILWSPGRVDYRDRYLSKLEPNHRLVFSRFRTTGVLAPFGVDVSHFTEPNRLLFSPDGQWLTFDNANPLFGWDLRPVLECGQRHGTTRGDAIGCLFFYIKEQFRTFAARAKDFRLDLTLSQTDARVLSQALVNSSVQNFHNARFDRIETSNVADYVGASVVIKAWAPLLNKSNPHSALLMNFMNWIVQHPHSQPSKAGKDMRLGLAQQSAAILGLSLKQAVLEGARSSRMINVIESMEAFYDNEPPFSDFLKTNGALQAAFASGVRLRSNHRIHPKRSGLALDNPNQKIPNLTRTEFYDLFLLGSVNYSDRFIEIEVQT